MHFALIDQEAAAGALASKLKDQDIAATRLYVCNRGLVFLDGLGSAKEQNVGAF